MSETKGIKLFVVVVDVYYMTEKVTNVLTSISIKCIL